MKIVKALASATILAACTFGSASAAELVVGFLRSDRNPRGVQPKRP